MEYKRAGVDGETLGERMSDVLVVGLFALYVWVWASQLHTPLFGGVQRWLRTGWRFPLVSCAWCSGFWLSALGVSAIHYVYGRLDWVLTPVSIAAAAAVCGFLGSLTPGIDPEDA